MENTGTRMGDNYYNNTRITSNASNSPRLHTGVREIMGNELQIVFFRKFEETFLLYFMSV